MAKIQESVDNVTWSDVADANLDGVTGNPAGFALAASSVKTLSYVATKRYVRVILATVTGTAPIVRASASVIRTVPKTAP